MSGDSDIELERDLADGDDEVVDDTLDTDPAPPADAEPEEGMDETAEGDDE